MIGCIHCRSCHKVVRFTFVYDASHASQTLQVITEYCLKNCAVAKKTTITILCNGNPSSGSSDEVRFSRQLTSRQRDDAVSYQRTLGLTLIQRPQKCARTWNSSPTTRFSEFDWSAENQWLNTALLQCTLSNTVQTELRSISLSLSGCV